MSWKSSTNVIFWKPSTNVTFSESRLQIFADLSTNCQLAFYKFAKNPPRNGLFVLVFWTVSALVTSKTPNFFARFAREVFTGFLQIFTWISTNFHMNFYKFQHGFLQIALFYKFFADLRILLQMSLFSSTNVIFQKLLSTNFTDFFYKFFCNFRGGGATYRYLYGSLW